MKLYNKKTDVSFKVLQSSRNLPASWNRIGDWELSVRHIYRSVVSPNHAPHRPTLQQLQICQFLGVWETYARSLTECWPKMGWKICTYFATFSQRFQSFNCSVKNLQLRSRIFMINWAPTIWKPVLQQKSLFATNMFPIKVTRASQRFVQLHFTETTFTCRFQGVIWYSNLVCFPAL